jgi:hypothetical protein
MWHVWGRGDMRTGFGGENLRERDHLENPGLNGSIILRHLQEVGCEGVDWIDLPEDIDRWRALVNAVMNLRVT